MRRLSILGSLALILALAACGTPIARVAALTHRPPLAPTDLKASVDGRTIAANGWTNSPAVQFSATLKSPDRVNDLVPEVEILQADQPFSGAPNATGKEGASSLILPSTLLQAGQRYHWQIRAREPGGKAGPWVPFDGTVGYDPSSLPAPNIDPLPRDGWVSSKQIHISWSALAGRSGAQGFAYSVDRSESDQPPAQTKTSGSSATVSVAGDGDWFFHVRTLNKAGTWSPTATLPLHVDTVPLKIVDPFYRTYAYNPDFDTLPIAFSLSKPAAVTITILPDKSDMPVRTYDLGQQQDKVKAEWDGKDSQGKVVPAGSYRFRAIATDKAGNTADVTYDKLLVSSKRIVVSLSQQKLWAYDGDKAVLQSLVTTGGPLLPTPEGTFQILSKQTGFVFHSPWPKSSPFWYPDSPTNYAMMFDTAGYFIHDAPWRHRFGPGSNLVAGQPGEESSGTHGCVNVPLDVQAKLFAWTDPGTPVVIQQ